MRIFCVNKDASFICFEDGQYPVKNQVADVPDHVGASLLVFPEYELFTGQVEIIEEEKKKSTRKKEDAAE